MNILLSIALALLLAAAALVLARALPAQNVALILGLLIAWEVALEVLWSGPGPQWRGPLFWPATVVLAREGIRWILRRRQARRYGLQLIVLAGAVTALAQCAIALPGAHWAGALQAAVVRFGSTAFCLFWLSAWFISKFAQQP